MTKCFYHYDHDKGELERVYVRRKCGPSSYEVAKEDGTTYTLDRSYSFGWYKDPVTALHKALGLTSEKVDQAEAQIIEWQAKKQVILRTLWKLHAKELFPHQKEETP